ncbi:MAG: hypothetical protein NTV14_08490 [Coprothermobacterota bacterium]|nr:hypothetical protein [Coprothermobacterota bacterium]
MNTVNIMESNTKRDMKVMAEIVGAANTSSKVLTESGAITVDVVAGAINITEAWGSTDSSYPAKKSSPN